VPLRRKSLVDITFARPNANWLLLALALGACASAPIGQIQSEPEGARVYATDGKELGVTPLDPAKLNLPDEAYSQLIFRKDGYLDAHLVIERRALDNVRFKLLPLGADGFQKNFVQPHAVPISQLVQEYLIAQGHLGARRFEAAERSLRALETKYPQLAATSVLWADLYMAQGKRPQAIDSLKQALRLNPTEPLIKSALERLEAKP